MSDEETQNNPIESPVLPEGYEFVDKNSIQPNEIINLRESVGWLGDTEKNWQQAIEQPLGVIVGVRSTEGELVGMGRITADPRHVVLCDLAVRQEHRHQGIARAIIDKRMRIISERDVPYTYAELAPTSPFRDLYKHAGLVATGNTLYRNTR